MIDVFNELKEQLSIINILNDYYIEFGILTEDQYKIVEVNILNTDESITKMPMFVGDVMYLTEYGTLTIPARPILELSLKWVNDELDTIIDEIFTGVLKYNWSSVDIDTRMQRFATEVQIYIQSQMERIIQSNSTLASLLNVEDENKYLYDLNKLKYYIKCRVFKKN